MSVVTDSLPDVALFRGRRGQVAVVHLRGPSPGDPLDVVVRAADHALVMRPRWLVLDLTEMAEGWEGHHVVRALRRRLGPAGVRLAVAGGRPRTVRPSGSGAGLGCPSFPTVPVALGTLGAL